MQMYLSIKRVLDCIGAIVMLPFVFLVIVVFAPIIWVTDKGPVLYIAEDINRSKCINYVRCILILRI